MAGANPLNMRLCAAGRMVWHESVPPPSAGKMQELQPMQGLLPAGSLGSHGCFKGPAKHRIKSACDDQPASALDQVGRNAGQGCS